MRLIEADAVYKILESCEIKKDTYGSLLNDWDHGYNCGIERAESEIECAPTVEAELVRHGCWKPARVVDDCFWVCSSCGFPSEASSANILYKYCPVCGAKMDAERKEE